MGIITYFSEDIAFRLPQKRKISAWIKSVIQKEGFELVTLNYVFCSDAYLLQMNRDYLNHDYYTDIITFSQTENPKQIEGDIFISVDRVKENAQLLSTDFNQELRRVIIHGVLHLFGYDDHNDIDRQQMRDREDLYLLLCTND